MRKFVVFIIVSLCLVMLSLDTYSLASFDCFPLESEVTFYVPQTLGSVSNANIIANGNSSFVRTSMQNYSHVKSQLPHISGESITYKGSRLDKNTVLTSMRAVVVDEQLLNGIQIIYAYSPDVDYELIIDGKKVNVMIAVSEKSVTVGCPVILGSF